VLIAAVDQGKVVIAAVGWSIAILSSVWGYFRKAVDRPALGS
jgi:hypothetical protein